MARGASARAHVRSDAGVHGCAWQVDTDVMLSEEPPYGATDKPSELYAIIEHFSNGRRRLELFGEDTNIRRGWLTLGSSISSSNHDPYTWRQNFEGSFESYNFEDELPQVLPNPLLGTTLQIESLRPKSCASPAKVITEPTCEALVLGPSSPNLCSTCSPCSHTSRTTLSQANPDSRGSRAPPTKRV